MSSQAPQSRQRSRQAALQVLYAVEFDNADGVTVDTVFDSICEHFELPEGARVFAKELVAGVCSHRAEIDDLIGQHATHWRLERMAAVDRNILRIGVYELGIAGMPMEIAVDEAVLLAQRFGGDRSGSFINGVLDSVGRAQGPAREEART